jgi:phage tail-like protein
MDSSTEERVTRAVARPFTSARFSLEVNGANAGFIKSVEGGGITAEVISEKPGADYFVHKHIGRPKYEDVTLTTDLSLDPAFYDWIASSWNGQYARKDGTVYILDNNNKIMRQDEYINALISEVSFSACDAASKDACKMSVKLAPEYTRFKKGSGKLTVPVVKGHQKIWLASNFRLEIDGLDCTRVNKVEAFSVKQTVVQDQVGEQRDFPKEVARVEFPNLVVSLAESHAQTWQDWFDDFVVKGNNGQENEKNGSLTFLAPDLKTTLATINFFNLGIFRLTPDKVEARNEQIRRLQAELYVERMQFVYPKPVN